MNLRIIASGDSKPVAEAEVRVLHPESEQEFDADAEGRCTLDPGNSLPDYLGVFVRKPGFVPKRAVWEILDASSLPADFTIILDPAIRIGGQVQEENGAPIAGAIVHLIIYEPNRQVAGNVQTDLFDKAAITDAHGRWQFDEAPEDFAEVMFRLAHRDFVEELHFKKADIPAEQFRRESVIWQMQRGVRVAGMVTDHLGHPISGAEILPGEDRVCSGEKPIFWTNEAGEFSIPHALGQRNSLTVKAEGYAPALIEFGVQTGMGRLRIAVEPGRTIRGRIVSAKRAPIAGAHVFAVTWRHHRTLEWRTMTDTEGRFEWRNAPADEVQFDILKKDYRGARSVPMTAGEEEYEIVLHKPLVVRGSVTDAKTGKAIEAFRVIPGAIMQNGRTYWMRERAVPLNGGVFEWSIKDDAREGTIYILRVEAEGYQSAVLRLPSSAEELAHDFALQPGPSRDWCVLSPDGTPAANATVAVVFGNPAFLHGETFEPGHGNLKLTSSADGRFAFPPEEPPYAMVAAHQLGVCLATAEELAETHRLQLQQWGRLEITTDAEAAAEDEIQFYVHYYDLPTDSRKMPWVTIQPAPKRIAGNRIVFEKLPPGNVHLGRYNQSNHDALNLVIEAGRTIFLDFDRGTVPATGKIPGTVVAKVIDEAGNPVQGATVESCGFRLKGRQEGFSTVASRVAPAGMATNRHGVVTIGYPQRFGHGKEVEAVILHVQHPDFCPVRAECPVTGEALPIVLRRGAVVRVTGFAETGELRGDLYIQMVVDNRSGDVEAGTWTREGNNTLVNRHVPPGKILLRLVRFANDAGTWFSEVREVHAESDAPLELRIAPRSGRRFIGRLDDAVPRPVLNGRVVANVSAESKQNGRPLVWRAHAHVSPDGSFVIESLPPGDVELIALCDGFASKNPTGSNARHGRLPQRFEACPVVIVMEPTATVRAHVTGRVGKPLPDAHVHFSPNVTWADRSNGLFSVAGLDTCESLRLDRDELQKRLEQAYRVPHFHGTTDENGLATIVNIPTGKQKFSVFAAGYAMECAGDFPFAGFRDIELSPGEVRDLSIVMDQTAVPCGTNLS